MLASSNRIVANAQGLNCRGVLGTSYGSPSEGSSQ